MVVLENCWATFLAILNFVTFNSINQLDHDVSQQTPLIAELAVPKKDYPIFNPPNGPENGGFVCSYPTLTDYEFCSQTNDRSCWLKPKNPRSLKPTFGIHSDYENIWPTGVTRKYTIEVHNATLFPDGYPSGKTKVFPLSYPGPWIEACWGDDIEVTVINHLPCNGTSIHWHGIRMWNNNENDGVNAVTQCPIAPGQSSTYKFHTRQYGTSWYHSHYSLQYADGMAGPLTIHGPTSANYDTAIDPILMTDWNQRSAFEDWGYTQIVKNGTVRPKMTSILLNGHGIAPPGTCANPRPASLHNISFQKGKKYLLRLINTSVDAAFVFSIDGHNLTVVESDFVPIHNYTTNSVLIGIGQRYHVIVEAKPIVVAKGDNYWIRTVPARGCGSFNFPYTRDNATTGIVRYTQSTANPQSVANSPMPIDCSDEPYEKLRPILEWHIPEDITSYVTDVNIGPKGGEPYFPSPINRWQMYKSPLWLNFSDPTILNTENSSTNFTAQLKVDTRRYAQDQWVRLVVTGPNNSTVASHPIHLHGHDFALLAQDNVPWNESTKPILHKNPPRRDVALLPNNGYLLIAFKVDNPGVWLMHCHIAWHASSGLAMQIMENVDDIVYHDKNGLKETCAQWSDWFANSPDRKPGTGQCRQWEHFQDDSGI
ncbi:multicopper oxidase [Amniculicola lignicola CBS 123094]|uniref:Multicopper oxidase n=1 Tax=Amniculicola lignicola CBS 123094 TaxID=1392246 RepID=A0A6A5WPV9_9PLEO|nr:multicopper oxidase [Amniculicola lignicola CBS 123094]